MKKVLQKKLLIWYRVNRRALPWRNTRDPYRIWLSEIMLQQTQVKTVVPYYRRFLQKFQTVGRLARATLDDVLKLWEGLGYYSRARNLHRAARQVVEGWGGKFPRDVAMLRKLPGVGRYTAGAIASIAFGERVPVLDGNVERVLCRVEGIEEDPRHPTIRERLWERATALLPGSKDVPDFNQGLMELGAMLCTPREPSCSVCPIQTLCKAYRIGKTEQIPFRRKKAKLPIRRKVALMVRTDSRVLLRKRPPHGLLGGLWEFPMIEGEQEPTLHTLFNGRKLVVAQHWQGEKVLHQFTHFKEFVTPFHYRLKGKPPKISDHLGMFQWVGTNAFPKLALTKTAHKLFAQL